MANINENEQELFTQTPLLFLRPNTLKTLGDFLNTPKLLPSSRGLSRDWRGLASVADLNFEETNRLQSDPNPTKRIILIWCEKNKSGTSRKISVQDFFDCVKNQLDRRDLYDDSRIRESIKSDCLSAKERFTNISSEPIEPIDIFGYYDAMVLHGDAREDELFAEDLIERLEAVNLKVFVKERDLVAGTLEHAESCKIIQERCKKVIAVFSSSFFQSNENKFLTNFAQYVGIQQGISCKIIPIILNPETKCDIPQQFQMYSKLPYNPHSKMVNFWNRLIIKTLEVQGPLPIELTEYKNYRAGNNQIQTDNRLQIHTPMNPNANRADYAESTVSSSMFDQSSEITQSTLVSNLNNTEQSIADRNTRVQAMTNSQNFRELSDISGSLPTTLSLTDTQQTIGGNSTALLLPDPPTHEPGGSSRNKGKAKGVKNKIKGMFSSKK